MIIRKLALENFRSYLREEIEFPQGTILLEGDVGSGKSSVLYAIEFALFGLGEMRGESLLRTGKNQGSVEMVFEINGRRYRIKRTLSKRRKSVAQTEGFIEVEGRREHLAPSELKERVLQILGFRENPRPKASSVIFRYAVFTPQEEMKEILRLKDEERLQTLRKAFGIEDYKTIKDNVKLILSELRSKIDFISGELAGFEERERELREVRKKIEEFEQAKSSLAQRYSALQEKLKEVSDKLEELNRLRMRLRELSAEIPLLEDSVREKAREIHSLTDEINSMTEQKRKIESELEAYEKQEFSEEDVIRKKRDAERRKNEINEEINRLRSVEAEIPLLESSLKEKKRELEDCINESRRLLGEIEKLNKSCEAKLEKPCEESEGELIERKNELERKKDELKEALIKLRTKMDNFRQLIEKGVCPTCERAVEHASFHEKIERIERDIRGISSELLEVKREIERTEQLREELRRYEERRREREMLLREIERNRAELKKLEARIKACEPQIRELETKLKEKRDYFEKHRHLPAMLNAVESEIAALDTALEKARRFGELLRERERLQSEIEKREKKIRELKGEMEKLERELKAKREEIENKKSALKFTEEVEKEKTEIENSIRDVISRMSHIEGNIEAMRKEERRLEREIEEGKHLLSQKRVLEEYKAWLNEFFAPAVDEIEKAVLSNINYEFDSLFRKYFSMLMESGDLSVRIDENFAPVIEQNGYEISVDSLSGGERTSVAFAYRVALNLMVQRVCTSMRESLLILDEPTDGFSKEQIFRMREVLEDLKCDQVIIVSHEKELEGFVDKIYRVVKEGGVSRIRG